MLNTGIYSSSCSSILYIIINLPLSTKCNKKPYICSPILIISFSSEVPLRKEITLQRTKIFHSSTLLRIASTSNEFTISSESILKERKRFVNRLIWCEMNTRRVLTYYKIFFLHWLYSPNSKLKTRASNYFSRKHRCHLLHLGAKDCNICSFCARDVQNILWTNWIFCEQTIPRTAAGGWSVYKP